VTARVHHSAIVVRDVEASLRFWRDGVGFEVTMDMHFDGDWSTLFGAPANRLRSIFLGDPARPDAGIVELVQFGSETTAQRSVKADEGSREAAAASPAARPGFFLLSCYVDVDTVLDRLRALDLGGEPRRIVVPGPGGDVQMATVVDPDGVLVELIGVPTTP
jgi:catechol 2,3-dioxygenase-like lactoylglutathione lyase family enzyme